MTVIGSQRRGQLSSLHGNVLDGHMGRYDYETQGSWNGDVLQNFQNVMVRPYSGPFVISIGTICEYSVE